MRMTIRVKLLGGFLIVVGILAIVALVGFNGVNKVAGGAVSISNSAALDDAAMNMIIALQLGMDAESQALISGYSQDALDQFEDSVVQFDQAEDVITELGTEHQRELLAELVVDHDDFQNSVLVTLEYERATNGQSALLRVNENVTSLFASAANVMTALVASPSSTSAALDQAGAQRMRAYKMAFLANAYSRSSGEEQTSIAAELTATMTGFQSVTTGLRDGSNTLGLSGTSDSAVRARLDEVDVAWAPFSADLTQVIAVSGKHGDAVANSDESTVPIIANIFEELNGFEVEVEAFGDSMLAGAKSAKSSAINLTLIVSLIGFAIAIGIGLFLSRAIANGVGAMLKAATDIADRTLPELVAVTDAVATGDLTRTADIQVEDVNVNSKDEIGDMARAFNSMGRQLATLGVSNGKMVVNLRDIVGKVNDGAEGVAGASDQLSSSANQAGEATQGIAATSQEVAKGSDEQARSVESTQGSLGELTLAVNEIAKGSADQQEQVAQALEIVKQVSESAESVAQNAQVAANGASDVNDAARNGQEMMKDTIEGIRGIERAVGSVSTRVSELGTQSAEIGKIIGVIDDIADQTNLLALNAAIEAARAGDQGRGFAVVADEVRQLAERVTEATKEIAVLIEVVQTGVEDSMRATEEGTEQVSQGVDLAEKAAGALQQIIDSVTDVTGQIEQISAGAEEVSASGDEMVRTVESVAEISERNASSADQMRSSSTSVEQAMDGIAAITEQSSASAQEASAGAEEMSAQVEEVVASSETLAGMAQGLKSAVGIFRLKAEDDLNVSAGPA